MEEGHDLTLLLASSSEVGKFCAFLASQGISYSFERNAPGGYQGNWIYQFTIPATSEQLRKQMHNWLARNHIGARG